MSITKERKTGKMTYIWFWVHSLAQHAPKSPKYPIIKFGQLAARKPTKAAQIIWKLHFLTQMWVLRKKQGEDYQTKKSCKNVLYLILGTLVRRPRPKIC